MAIEQYQLLPWNRYRRAMDKVRDMSNEQLQRTWDALTVYDPQVEYASGVSMDDWVQLIYSEMDQRGMPHF